MDVDVIVLNGRQFIDLSQSAMVVDMEGDLNDLLSLCYEHDTNTLLIGEKNLSQSFFDLGSGLAGAAMQKFANYQVKAAVVLAANVEYSKRFKELRREMERSRQFRFFTERDAAEQWLTQ